MPNLMIPEGDVSARLPRTRPPRLQYFGRRGLVESAVNYVAKYSPLSSRPRRLHSRATHGRQTGKQ